MPRMTVAPAIAAGRLVEVPVRQLKLEKLIRMVYRREEALSHAARAFIQLVHSSDFTPLAFPARVNTTRRSRP